MAKTSQGEATLKPAGYVALIERYGLEVIPNWHRSMVTTRGIHRIDVTPDMTEEVYPPGFWPGDGVGEHLEFALKYDGTNLGILASLFQRIAKAEIEEYVRFKPYGKYARRVWYLYEFLTGTALELEELKRGSYVDLLESDQYYTTSPGRPVRRQRVNDNLLGNSKFCPMVRRTDALKSLEAVDLQGQCRQTVSNYSPEMLKRTISYLYSKETKSSFKIENIEPSKQRIARFIELLQLAESQDFINKAQLIMLQNRIVDERFTDSDYRAFQNYVGHTMPWQKEVVHFASPKPEDLPNLMDGLEECHRRIRDGGISPVTHAAIIAYGFVFLHPFRDGNGRIHRFLIHNILALQGFTPSGFLFPISASMLNDMLAYDASLEAFSTPLMALVDYELDETGQMVVINETAIWYRYIDMTAQAEALYRFIDHTITHELVEELIFLANYDTAKKAIQDIIDMPDRKIDLFIQLCLENNGRLSKAKRKSQFDVLTDAEISSMEKVIQSVYASSIAGDD